MYILYRPQFKNFESHSSFYDAVKALKKAKSDTEYLVLPLLGKIKTFSDTVKLSKCSAAVFKTTNDEFGNHYRFKIRSKVGKVNFFAKKTKTPDNQLSACDYILTNPEVWYKAKHICQYDYAGPGVIVKGGEIEVINLRIQPEIIIDPIEECYEDRMVNIENPVQSVYLRKMLWYLKQDGFFDVDMKMDNMVISKGKYVQLDLDRCFIMSKGKLSGLVYGDLVQSVLTSAICSFRTYLPLLDPCILLVEPNTIEFMRYNKAFTIPLLCWPVDKYPDNNVSRVIRTGYGADNSKIGITFEEINKKIFTSVNKDVRRTLERVIYSFASDMYMSLPCLNPIVKVSKKKKDPSEENGEYKGFYIHTVFSAALVNELITNYDGAGVFTTNGWEEFQNKVIACLESDKLYNISNDEKVRKLMKKILKDRCDESMCKLIGMFRKNVFKWLNSKLDVFGEECITTELIEKYKAKGKSRSERLYKAHKDLELNEMFDASRPGHVMFFLLVLGMVKADDSGLPCTIGIAVPNKKSLSEEKSDNEVMESIQEEDVFDVIKVTGPFRNIYSLVERFLNIGIVYTPEHENKKKNVVRFKDDLKELEDDMVQAAENLPDEIVTCIEESRKMMERDNPIWEFCKDRSWIDGVSSVGLDLTSELYDMDLAL